MFHQLKYLRIQGTRYWCSTTLAPSTETQTTNNVPGSPNIPATGTTDIRESTTVSHTVTGNGNTGVPMNPNPALTTSTSLTGATNSATNPSHETGVNTGSGGSTNIVTPPSSATATVVIPGTDNGATTKVKIQLVATLMDLLLPPIYKVAIMNQEINQVLIQLENLLVLLIPKVLNQFLNQLH